MGSGFLFFTAPLPRVRRPSEATQMEELSCSLHSHGSSPRLIPLSDLSARETLLHSIADWLGLVQPPSFCPVKDCAAEDPVCPLDEGYRDLKALLSNGEPRADLDFSPVRIDFSETEPPHGLFEDLEVIGDPQEEHGVSWGHELAIEKDELVSHSLTATPYLGYSRERLRSFGFGCAVHLAAFSLFVAAPVASLRGLGGISDQPVLVKLVESRQIDTPDSPTPASVDSPASAASLARRDPKPEETDIRKETKNEVPKQDPEPQVLEETNTEARPADPKPQPELTVERQQTPPERSHEGPPNNSKALQDSVASAPSVAHPERKGSVKAGNEALTYRDRILAAIHEASYYPRKALRHMAHGQIVVSFTINKDGSLAHVAIVTPAKSTALNDAALKIVEKASSHFPPVPASFVKEKVTYVLPIVFKKGG